MENQQEALWKEILERAAQYGEILYAGNIGSRLFNLHRESSDIDAVVIVRAPLQNVIGPEAKVESFVESSEGSEYDLTIHEVRTFCELLAGGDPRMLEALYASIEHQQGVSKGAVAVCSPKWMELVAIVDEIIAKQFAKKYVREIHGNKGLKKVRLRVGYADEETKEEERAAMQLKVAKIWSVLFRIAENALYLLQHQTMRVWLRDDSEVRRRLLACRSGGLFCDSNELHEGAEIRFDNSVTYNRASELHEHHLETMLQKVSELCQTSSLAELPNVDAIQQWLLSVRVDAPDYPHYSLPDITPNEDQEIVCSIFRKLNEVRGRQLLVAFSPEAQCDVVGVYVAATTERCSLSPCAGYLSIEQDGDRLMEISEFVRLIHSGALKTKTMLYGTPIYCSSYWKLIVARCINIYDMRCHKAIQNMAKKCTLTQGTALHSIARAYALFHGCEEHLLNDSDAIVASLRCKTCKCIKTKVKYHTLLAPLVVELYLTGHIEECTE